MAKKKEFFDNHIALQGIYADGSLGSPGQVLASDGENVYWADGGGGGDADTLEGHPASDFVLVSDYSDSDVLAKILNVDGSGSGLDADLLDGQSGAYYLAWANFSGKPSTAVGYGITGGANLDAFAGLTLIADRLAYADGTGTLALATFTSAARNLLDDTSAGAMLTTLGALAASSYTAADVLSKLLTVDGAGSGLDADLLDGQSSAYYLAASSYTAADVLSKLLTVDGSGSGLDADLLDGQSGAYYLAWANFTSKPTTAVGYGITGGANLDAFAGLTLVADRLPYANGTGTLALATFTSAARNLLDDTTSAAMLTTLGALPASSYTAADVLSKLLTVDGAGSGLDADLLDGLSSAAFAQLASNPVFSAAFSGSFGITLNATDSYAIKGRFRDNGTTRGYFGADSTYSFIVWDSSGNQRFDINNSTYAIRSNGSAVITAATYTAADVLSKLLTVDGSGSGLDADLWDGNNFATYLNQALLTSSSPSFAAATLGGLTLDSSNTYEPQINIYNRNNDASGPYIIFRKEPADTTMTNGDNLGSLLFYGRGSSSSGAGSGVFAAYTGTRGTNWVSSNLYFFSTNTSGVAKYTYFNADGTITSDVLGTIWGSSNDGTGSGLDADLWDGNEFATYLNQALLTSSSPTFVALTTTSGITLGTTITANATSTRDKIRVWNAGTYSIGMGSGYTFGNLNDYAMTFQMSATAQRGWWWGTSSHTNAQGSMSLSTQGNLHVLNSITVASTSNTVWHLGNDGSGSGLDADLLDGLNSTAFGRLASANSWAGATNEFTDPSNSALASSNDSRHYNLAVYGNGTGPALLSFHRPGAYAAYFGLDTDNIWKVGGWSMGSAAYKVWHEGNDGSGSGLDADLLDGYQASSFALLSGAVFSGRVYIKESSQSALVFRNSANSDKWVLGRSAFSDDAQNFFLYNNDTGTFAFTISSTNDTIFHGNVAVRSYGGTAGFGVNVSSVGGIYAIEAQVDGTPYFQVRQNGLTYTQGGTVSNISMRRLKKNIEENAPYQFDDLTDLRVRRFEWRDKLLSGRKRLGLIVDEVEDILPETVNFDDKGEADSVSYTDVALTVSITTMHELKKTKNELRSAKKEIKNLKTAIADILERI